LLELERGSPEPANAFNGVDAEPRRVEGLVSGVRGSQESATRFRDMWSTRGNSRATLSSCMWDEMTAEQKKILVDSRVRRMVNENVLATTTARKGLGESLAGATIISKA